MYQLLKTIANERKSRRAIQVEIEKLRAKAKDNYLAKKETELDAITEMARDFLIQMEDVYTEDRYIYGGFSSAFTKFVSRGLGNWPRLSTRHAEAVKTFTTAKQNLNRVFVEELKMFSADGDLRNAFRFSSLKNLDKLDQKRSYRNKGFFEPSS